MNKKVLEKIKSLSNKDPFLLTVTTYNSKKKKNQLDTFVFTNNFPYSELESTKDKIIELIDGQTLTQLEKM